MINIGIDIIEISRMQRILNRNNFFLESCFSDTEIKQLKKKSFFCASVSAHFCAKEAFYKCIGESISYIKYFKEVNILNFESGAPYILLSYRLKKKYSSLRFSVSMSHCIKFACATVISENIE